MQKVFQKERPQELKENYVQSLFETYGSFHPVINPAIFVLKGEVEYMQSVSNCRFCYLLTNCIVYVPTKKISMSFSICKPCMQDFNMFIFNKSNLKYCREIKLPRIPYDKNI